MLVDEVEDKRSASSSLRSFVVPSFAEENPRNAKRDADGDRGDLRSRSQQTSSFPGFRIISAAEAEYWNGETKLASHATCACVVTFV